MEKDFKPKSLKTVNALVWFFILAGGIPLLVGIVVEIIKELFK